MSNHWNTNAVSMMQVLIQANTDQQATVRDKLLKASDDHKTRLAAADLFVGAPPVSVQNKQSSMKLLVYLHRIMTVFRTAASSIQLHDR